MNEQDLSPSENEVTPANQSRDGGRQSNVLLTVACILSGISIFLMLLSPVISLLTSSLFSLSGRGEYPTPNTAPTVEGEDISQETLEKAMDFTVIVTAGGNVGTGVIIREDGYILTNYHVVSEGKSPSVILRSDEKQYSATLIGYSDRLDVAVLKIEAVNLPVASFAASDAVRYGERVYAIGTPTGVDFGWSVTQGIVSCPKRELKTYTEDGKLEKTATYVQTDAAVDHGNSGGALINVRGEVIGIVTLRHSKTDRLGLAIPADEALEEAIGIIEQGK